MNHLKEIVKNDCATETCKHQRELKLVNRIQGQVGGIGNMLEQGRYCLDVINQVRAARAALKTLETRILETHLRTCVSDSFKQSDASVQDEKIQEILDLFRRYESE